MSHYLDRLARFAADVRLDALPPATVAAAKLVFLDTLGAMLAGSALVENSRLARLAAARSPRGTSTLVGHGAGADSFWAALSNATAGVALEMDEGNRLGGGHPAIHVIPGTLARGSPAAGSSRRSSPGTRSARAWAARRRRVPMSTRTAPGGRSARRWPSPGSRSPPPTRSATS